VSSRSGERENIERSQPASQLARSGVHHAKVSRRSGERESHVSRRSGDRVIPAFPLQNAVVKRFSRFSNPPEPRA
jgi:hypothetical protein